MIFHGQKIQGGSSSNGYQYSNFEDFCFELKEFKTLRLLNGSGICICDLWEPL